ncbi:MAG: hypothetical protein MUO85_08460 [candidate division Zixibacteria bacterium]|nr:hypothetical protein [candidate division Zixibacteria bacterium]
MNSSVEHTDFKIKYDGKLHQIDSNTLINSLFNITAAMQEINRELNRESSSKVEIQIKVNAFSKGCFLLHFELIKSVADDLLAPTAILVTQTDIYTTIKIFVEFIRLKLFLKGEKPQEINKSEGDVTIINNKGNIVVDKRTFNVYTKNEKVNEAFTKNFETLREDSAIDGFDFNDRTDRTLIHIPKEDFNALTLRNELLEEEIKTETIPEASLYIIKLVFEENRKWEFYYQGNKISATMEDETFSQKIDKGEKFGKGDILVCNLEVEKIFDTEVNTYVNRSYRILKILQHIPCKSQGELLIKD